MGVVYTARDSLLGRVVALKTLKSQPGPEQLERFRRETRAIARLDHPHIVPIYDVGQHGDQNYFAMGFMPGGSLDRNSKRFGEPRAAAVLVEKVARAMHCVHQHGILHRDLKPGNILLDEHGEPRVGDFGLAKFRDSQVDITHPGAILGTPAYMAPEQARGQVDCLGPATDVWALGVILYQLLTGKRPFEANRPEVVTSMICTEEPKRPRALRPGLDRDLETITLKCLEKNPPSRYSSAVALADDLGRWLAGESIVAQSPSLLARSKRFWRRHPAITSSAVLIALFVPLLLVLLIFTNRTPETGPPLANLRQIQQELARGLAVELVPEQGLPRWYRPQVGKFDLHHPNEQTSPFSLRNMDVGALELLPDPPVDGYRLSGEARINEEYSENYVGVVGGLCVGRVASPSPDGGTEQWWVSLAYSNRASGGEVALELHRYRAELPDRPRRICNLRLTGRALPPDQRRGQLDPVIWRHLRTDVTPLELAAYWEGDQLITISATELEQQMRILAWQAPRASVWPSARSMLQGGVGLYILHADSWYRHVLIEPMR
jgi:serine/threonine protein kinase